MHNIDWCDGGMKLAEIAANNVDEPYLTLTIKYIIVRLDS